LTFRKLLTLLNHNHSNLLFLVLCYCVSICFKTQSRVSSNFCVIHQMCHVVTLEGHLFFLVFGKMLGKQKPIQSVYVSFFITRIFEQFYHLKSVLGLFNTSKGCHQLKRNVYWLVEVVSITLNIKILKSISMHISTPHSKEKAECHKHYSFNPVNFIFSNNPIRKSIIMNETSFTYY